MSGLDSSQRRSNADAAVVGGLSNRPFLLAIFDPEGKVDNKDGKVGGDRRESKRS